MKKRYILLIIIAVIAFTLLGSWYFIANHHDVVFSLQNGDYSLQIDNAAGKKITTITTKNSSVWLWKGAYSYRVVGDRYDTTAQKFIVTDSDQKISVNPNYSDDYLASLLSTGEYSAITAQLQPYLSKAPANSYTIQSLVLYMRGQWAGGTIVYQPTAQDIAETYRFVLEKTANSWRVTVPPVIAIYAGDYPQVPRAILDSLYR